MTAGAYDLIAAAAALVERAGGADFEIGYLSDTSPHRWYARARFKGARIMADEHKTPTAAALELAEKLLDGGNCRCGQTITLGDADHDAGCRWTLQGARWTPGCDAPPIPAAERGDLEALRAAYKAHTGKEPNL